MWRSATTNSTYDANGNRTQRVINGLTETYSYDNGDKLSSKIDSTGTRTYLRDGVGVTSPLLSDGAATYTPGISERRGSTTTYQLDGLKNTFAQSDANGGHVSSRNYDAFGAVTSSSGTHQGPFGYGGAYGYQTDPDTGLMLLGHRYYDSSTGRFLTRDPIKDGRNWYGYGGGFANPVNSVDPDGLMSFRADVVPTDEGLAWSGRSAPYGCPWLDGVAGFGDGVSGGLSRIVRGWLGAGDVVNTDSGAYGWGEIGGTVYSMVLPGPKGTGALSKLSDVPTPVSAIPGIYVATTKKGLKYVGQSQDLFNRIRPGHHANIDFSKGVDYLPMPGSTKLEREIAEHTLIEDMGGISQLANRRMPLGRNRLHLKSR